MPAKHVCKIAMLGCNTAMLVCSIHAVLLLASVLMSFGIHGDALRVKRGCVSAQAELQRGSLQHVIFNMLNCMLFILTLTHREEHTCHSCLTAPEDHSTKRQALLVLHLSAQSPNARECCVVTAGSRQDMPCMYLAHHELEA